MQGIGRLAPSPTGALHLGNARSFLLAWLSIRQQQGKLLLRIEDIDSPRVKPWAVQQTIEDLKWLGLDWDYGPDVGGPAPSYVQTDRTERYAEVLKSLQRDGCLYRCTCSRREATEAASAPHESSTVPVHLLEGTIYPGTCRNRRLEDAQVTSMSGDGDSQQAMFIGKIRCWASKRQIPPCSWETL